MKQESNKSNKVILISVALLLIILGILLGLKGCTKNANPNEPSALPSSTPVEAQSPVPSEDTNTDGSATSDVNTDTEVPTTSDVNTDTPVETPIPTQEESSPSPSPTVEVATPTPTEAETVNAPTSVPTEQVETLTPIPTEIVISPSPVPTQKPTSTPTQKPTSTPTQKPTSTPTQKPTSTPTQKPTSTPTEAVTVTTWKVTGKTPSSSTQQVFVNNMGAGWNLGNTLDATGGSGLNSETSWSNPKATQELIDAVYAMGFRTIRIPVSWHNHMDSKYNIDADWMARVKTVVDYAYNKGMYVIINSHHDCNSTKGYYPSEACKDASEAYLTAVWTQVANTFKSYDEHLIFEIMNEPRLSENSSLEWWPYNDDIYAKTLALINDYNQTGLDAIRATGGNNSSIRYVMFTTYAASYNAACVTSWGQDFSANFKVPTDSVKDHLIASIHAYEPYDMVMNSGQQNNNALTTDGKNTITGIMSRLYNRYVSKGIPVVITEFGIIDKNNLQDRTDYVGYYIAAAKAYGIRAVYWDNGAKGAGKSETYEILNRRTYAWTFESMAQAIIANVK